jgi:alpha-tubulin suppressor-like RCC1 family protein
VAGNNTWGQLGITGTSANIRQQSSSEAWAKIAAGGNRSFGIKTNSTLWGWGDGSSLSIYPNVSQSFSSPVNLESFILAGLGQASQVFCGNFHNVLITSLGNVLTWGGNNLYGELGIATNSNSSRLYYNNLKDGFGYDQSFTSQTFIQAACGVSHTLLLSDSGNLYSCGRNQFGQLGDGTFTDRNRFNLIGTGFAKISAGAWFSAAIKNNGDLYVWGHNSFGQVGNGTTVALNAPTQIILSNVQKVSCGYTHTLAIR